MPAIGKFVHKHPIISAGLALVVLVAGVFAWDISAALRGRFVARYQLWRGHYEVMTYGLPPRGLPECSRLLKQHYGIEMRAIAGCIVSHSQITYVEAHNAVVIAEMNRKFGRDVFQACMDDASSAPKGDMDSAVGR